MSAAVLLSKLQAVGARLLLDGNRLRCRAPKGALTPDLLTQLSTRKGELMDLLAGPKSPALARGWDQAKADKALAAALQEIERGKHTGRLTGVQKQVLDLFGGVFRRYSREQNPLLFQAVADIENQVRVIWGTKPPRGRAT